jgi:hypothetical protein
MVMHRNCVANSRNAGPHSLVCLLFSFQRPSNVPRSEILRLESSLERRGSREDNRFASRGRRIYHRRPVCVKRGSSPNRLSSAEGADFYINPPRPVKLPGHRLRRSALRRVLLLPFTEVPVKPSPNRLLRRGFRRATFYAFLPGPSRRTEKLQALPLGPSGSGVLLLPPCTVPRQAGSPDSLSLVSDRPVSGGGGFYPRGRGESSGLRPFSAKTPNTLKSRGFP